MTGNRTKTAVMEAITRRIDGFREAAAGAEMTGSPAAMAPREESRRPLASLLRSAATLGIAVTLERGCGFAANLLAARLGGSPQQFGAYSLAFMTASTVATYAGAGIGNTSTRFSAEHADNANGYGRLVRVLALISVVSAIAASLCMWLGAGPLARVLLNNPDLKSLLQAAALAAGAMILLECMRGFLIGSQAYGGLLLLSGTVGAGLLLGLPVAALTGPGVMILAYAAATMTGVLACAAFLRHWKKTGTANGEASAGPSVKRVWLFGLTQLAGVIGLNAAGWWVASLMARMDPTLGQMGLFAVATQLRNMVAVIPGFLGQASFARLTGSRLNSEQNRVFGTGMFLVTMAGLLAATIGIAVLPWALQLYGKPYRAAELTAALSMLTALIHMAGAPAAFRLNVVSLRWTAVINLIWSVAVAGLGFWLVSGGGALAAAAVYLVAHFLSSLIVLAGLYSIEGLPRGSAAVFLLTMLACLTLGGAAWMRWWDAAHMLRWTLAMLAAGLLPGYGLYRIARTQHWIGEEFSWRGALALLKPRTQTANL